MIGVCVLATIAVELRLYERSLVEVLPFLAVFIHPQFGEHLGDDVRHQARENGISGVLRGSGQDAEVEVLLDIKLVGNLCLQGAPLVEAEVVDYEQEHLLSGIQGREHTTLEDVGTHERTPFIAFYPFHVVLADELAKVHIGLALLQCQHLIHLTVGSRKLLFPVCQALINLHPVLERTGVAYLHSYLSEVLLIARLRHLGDYLLLMDILLQRQQYLSGIDGLYQVVGNLRTDGLVHDVLFLALGNHHHGCCRKDFLYASQCLQAADARHVLVEQYQVVRLLGTLLQSIESVGYGVHFISFFLKKQDVSLQQLNLIINPKQSVCSHIICLSACKYTTYI